MDIDARERLRRYVKRHKSQRAAAAALGVSQAFLSDVLHERRTLTNRVLVQLGLIRQTIIREIPNKTGA